MEEILKNMQNCHSTQENLGQSPNMPTHSASIIPRPPTQNLMPNTANFSSLLSSLGIKSEVHATQAEGDQMCRICPSTKGIGFYYGVSQICNSCRMFFRRCFITGKKPECVKPNEGPCIGVFSFERVRFGVTPPQKLRHFRKIPPSHHRQH